MPSVAVSYERDGAIAVLTIDDGKANAITHDVLRALEEGLARAQADGATAVVLAGRPGRFSAGFDLAVMTSGDEPMRSLVIHGAELLVQLFTFPAPVVSACTGHALAAGALLLLVSDVRIGADGNFKIGLNEVAIGMALPHFAVELARYRMPPSAFDSALLGQTFAPDAAVGAGYLDRVVPAESVVEDALETARALSALRTGAVGHTKQTARGPVAATITARLQADMATIGSPPA